MEFLPTDDLRNREIFLHLYSTFRGNAARQLLPTYYFTICRADGTPVGVCDLRVGHTADTYFSGNIGYTVYPKHRGRRYAGKACLLLFELAKKHGMESLIITCNPDNLPSKKTCEGLGGMLLDIVDLPVKHPMRRRGETKKCVFFFPLSEEGLPPPDQIGLQTLLLTS